MKKRPCMLLMSSCVVGAFLLGFLIRGALLPVSEHALPLDTTPQKTETATPITEDVHEKTTAWQKDAIYVGGDIVRANGRIYRAKWWTQGESPSTADVWEDIGTEVQQASPPVPPSTKTNTIHGFKVVGYYPSWKPSEISKLRWDVLTHVVYAFAIPTADGTLRPLENPETARQIIQQAHQQGAKVLLAVGGWSYQDTPLEATFVSATETVEKRKAFVQAILAMCEEYGFDGIDIDWEHPRIDGNAWKQYESLITDLAEPLHAEGKLLTSAVLSGVTPDGNIYYDAAAHSDTVLAAVDWIHVMAYDGGDGQRHSPYAFAVASAQYWKDTRHVPSAKVVLGVPFYGRPSWASYEDLLKANPQAWNRDISSINGMEAHYNGMATIEKKTAYAKEQLGGIMIWEVTQDTTDKVHSLMTAISNSIK